MAELEAFQRLLAHFRKLAPTVRGEFTQLWGERAARAEIRKAMQDTLPDLRDDDLEILADLEEPPRPHNWSVSIAHTASGGGWMAVMRPCQIGWDLEDLARIRLPLIERICSTEEIRQAPNPVFLWSAKEAFYKALEDEQPTVIGQVSISHWSQVESDLWTWQGLGPRNSEGALIQTSKQVWAAAIIF